MSSKDNSAMLDTKNILILITDKYLVEIFQKSKNK